MTGSAAVIAIIGISTVQRASDADPGGESKVLEDSAAESGGFAMAPTVDPDAPLEGELPRRVLALYDSSETVTEEDDHGNTTERPVDPEVALVHRFVELPLNHLGLAVEYHDVNDSRWPSQEEMSRYRGIVTWFGDERMRDPIGYSRWLGDQTEAGRRVVVMERLGALADESGAPVPRGVVDDLALAIGAEYLGRPTEDAAVISVVDVDEEMIGFERNLPARLGYYDGFRAPADAEVYLRLERTDIPSSQSDVAWTSRRGGFVLSSFAYSEDRLGERYVRRWLIDPFAFFEKALGVEGWPRPDFTTSNGRRIFYGHIDGDGLEMLSEIDYRSRCGAIVRDEILEHYRLPITASVVVGLTAPPPIGTGTEVDVEVARSIFALDNVEIGSHGLAHPMDWRGGSAAELSVPDLPDYELSGESEVAESVRYIDSELAPLGKRTRIMLWTGWTNPSEEQLAVAYRLGLRNLNGGDPRMDAHYPSYAHLVPPIHQVGPLFQFYTSAANDYILTDDWTPPYYRFQNVVQTFERTGAPRRIVPINVYFHFYIARNQAGLTGLRRVLDWVVDQPIAPVFASEYVDIARDFPWVRIARDGERWRLRMGSALRTLRFDDPSVHVDVGGSRGVLGYLQVPELGATYVHLDGSADVEIVSGDGPPDRLYLHEASHRVDDASFGSGRVRFATSGVGQGVFIFAGAEPGTRFVVRIGDEPEPRAEVRADAEGLLALTVDFAGPELVDVVLEEVR